MQNARRSPPSLRIHIPGDDAEQAPRSIVQKDDKPPPADDTKGQANFDGQTKNDTTENVGPRVNAEVGESKVGLVASWGQTTPKHYRGRPRFPADDDEFEPSDVTAHLYRSS